MAYDNFCTDSKKNGLGSDVGKKSYPLHKQISENKNAETKYGNNGFSTSKKGK